MWRGAPVGRCCWSSCSQGRDVQLSTSSDWPSSSPWAASTLPRGLRTSVLLVSVLPGARRSVPLPTGHHPHLRLRRRWLGAGTRRSVLLVAVLKGARPSRPQPTAAAIITFNYSILELRSCVAWLSRGRNDHRRSMNVPSMIHGSVL
jgi:hypothetical protein